MGDFVRDILNSPERKRRFNRERTLTDIVELIAKEMEDQGVSSSQLADRMGVSKSNVSQIMSGQRNLTVRTLSDILFCLGRKLAVASLGIDDE